MTFELQYGFKEGNKYAWDFAEFNFREFHCFSPSLISLQWDKTLRNIVQSSNTLSIFEFNGGKTRNVTLCKSQGKLLQLAYLANFCISFKPETNSVGCSKHCAWNAFVFKKPGLLFKNFEYSTRPCNGICDNNILQHYHEIHPILLN